MEDLDAATLDDVKEWFQTYYGPSNAVLVIAGDIDAKTARRKGRALLRRHSAGTAGGAARGLDRQDARGVSAESMQDRVPQARIYKVWNVPRLGLRRRRHLESGSLGPERRQVVPTVQAPRLQRSDRHRR